MKKITGLLVLSILVVLCFGLLWAYNGPGKNVPEPQDQNQTLSNALNTANHQIDAATMVRLIANNNTKNLRTTLSASAAKAAKTVTGGVFARSAFDKILQPGVVGIRYYFATKDNGNPTIVLVGVNAQGQDMSATIMEGSLDCPPWCAE
jgi:hypothetical protein